MNWLPPVVKTELRIIGAHRLQIHTMAISLGLLPGESAGASYAHQWPLEVTSGEGFPSRSHSEMPEHQCEGHANCHILKLSTHSWVAKIACECSSLFTFQKSCSTGRGNRAHVGICNSIRQVEHD